MADNPSVSDSTSDNSAAEAPTFRLIRDNNPTVPEVGSSPLPPADAEEAATMRVGWGTPPAESGEEATLRVGAALPPTSQSLFPSGSPSTSPTTNNRSRRALGYLEAGYDLGRGLVVEATIAPHETARPGVYQCHSPLYRQVVVKIAALNAPPDLGLWNRLAQLQHSHVLQTHETFEQDGFYFEVQEWCAGGTLAARIPRVGTPLDAEHLRWIESKLVPSFADGLAYLHSQEIIHRDIKPSNLYFRRTLMGEELVIGDFDISSLLNDGRTSRDTQRAAGTWSYAAPEAFPRFMDETGRTGSRLARASDWYSFGVVLLELIQGTTPLHGGDFPDVFDFYVSGRRLEVPQNLPQRLGQLLGGLLIRDRHARWGQAQVERWLQGQNTADDLAAIHSDRGLPRSGGGRPFTAFESRPASLPELAEAMLMEPQVAHEELLRSDVLINWIGEIDPLLAREVRRDREQWRNQPDVAVLCVILRCNPQTPAMLATNVLAWTAHEWAEQAQKAVQAGLTDAETLCHAGALMWLEQWLRLKNPPEAELALTVAQIRARREAAEATGTAREIENDTPFQVNLEARVKPSVAKGARSAGYAKARSFALEHEQITPADLAQGCQMELGQARRLAGQLERDEVLKRVEEEGEAAPFEPNAQAPVILEELRYAFAPEAPYLVGLDKYVRTPQELAHLCYSEGHWSETPPALFRAACARWQGGFLEAWLRQHLPARPKGDIHPVLVQLEELRERASKGDEGRKGKKAIEAPRPLEGQNEGPIHESEMAWALFDSVLRIFDPKLAPITLELTWSSPTVAVIPYGGSTTRILTYRARGAGVPLGALELQGAMAGVELLDHFLVGREGQAELHLRGGGDMQVGEDYHTRVLMRSRNAVAAKELAPLTYRVEFPRDQTVSRLFIGAGIGAAVLGVPRLIAMGGELPRAMTRPDFNFQETLTAVNKGQFNHLGPLVAALLLLGALYVAFRLWLWGLRNWGEV